MMSKAFVRACREACLRFQSECRGYRTGADLGPKGMEKLRKRTPCSAENPTRPESCGV